MEKPHNYENAATYSMLYDLIETDRLRTVHLPTIDLMIEYYISKEMYERCEVITNFKKKCLLFS